MTQQHFERHLNFESISNFRDLGGYKTQGGKVVGWRRLFRSGELSRMTGDDLYRLKDEIKLASVIDLRNGVEIERQGKWTVQDFNVKYFNIPLSTDSEDVQKETKYITGLSNMGEVYLYFISFPEYGRRVVKALELIADPSNHPLVFHCAIGKDRTGILAAILLGVLGVEDKCVVEDYTLTTPYMKTQIERMNNNSQAPEEIKSLPDYFWESTSDSMILFLTSIKREYGSLRHFVLEHGANPSLFEQLEKALLV